MTSRAEGSAASASVGERPAIPLAEVARIVGGRLSGDGTLRVSGVRPLDEAGAEELALVSSRRYLRFLDGSRAGAFLVSEELEVRLPKGPPRVVVADPARAVGLLLARFHPPPGHAPAVHPTAVLGAGVRLGDRVSVGAYAVLGPGVTLGDGTRIDAHVVLGDGTRIGRDCHIHPQVVVYPGTSIGDRVVVHAGVRLGADGYGYRTVDGEHRKTPQVGSLRIGDDVEIGANSTIDRGSLGDTTLGDGVKIDNLVHLGHNVRVGDRTMIAGMAGVAGSTRIGRGVWMGGQAGAIGHLDIGDGARLAVASRVMRDVPAGETVSGHPARPHREDLRRQAYLGRIPKLLERIEALERELAALRDGERPASRSGSGRAPGEEGSEDGPEGPGTEAPGGDRNPTRS